MYFPSLDLSDLSLVDNDQLGAFVTFARPSLDLLVEEPLRRLPNTCAKSFVHDEEKRLVQCFPGQFLVAILTRSSPLTIRCVSSDPIIITGTS